MGLEDNMSLKNDLIAEIQKGDKISVIASCFSMYAFEELKEQLCDSGEFRFIFTKPILNGENSFDGALCGSPNESKLRNGMMQKAIAREFVNWLKSDEVKL